MAIAVAPDDRNGPDDPRLLRATWIAVGIVIGLFIYAMLDAYVL